MSDIGYIGAPYNFVPFSGKVRHYQEKSLPGHNSVAAGDEEGGEKLISGEISYEITAVSDLFVGSGIKSGKDKTEQFYRDAFGRFAIPGSTVRGLIRSNAQILSLSEIGEDIDDYSLMFRNVASGPDKQKKRYADILGAKSIKVNDKKGRQSTISVLEKVRAGYISCKNGLYTIDDLAEPAPAMNGQKINYYILSERTVIHEYLSAKEKKQSCAYPFFFQNGGNILQHDNKKRFRESYDRNNRKHYINTENGQYRPYHRPCSYSVSGRTVLKVDAPGVLEHEGYAVSSGKMKEKKAIYIIPARKTEYEETEKRFPIKVSPKDVESFLTDLKKKETTLKQFGGREFFDLPKEGETRPVFYIEDGSRLYFGFTPRLRLFYGHTIAEGIPVEHKQGKMDYAKALFGWSSKEKSFKSRLSFTDAVISEPKKPGESIHVILAEPKPTSYLDYVVQNDDTGNNYNDDEFELRGIKQYWLRDKAETDVPDEKKDKEFVSKFAPLPAETQFSGKIRFHNLKEEEVGLLIWSVSLNGGAEMNIGKAKAFGYGRISMRITGAVCQDLEKSYDLSQLELAPWKELDTDRLVSLYKDKMREYLGHRPEQEESIKVLLMMKDPLAKPSDDRTRFMSIDNREYQNRKDPLQRPIDLVKRVKEEVKTDKAYKAEVTRVDGKKISFAILDQNARGNFGKFQVEDIVCREVSKKELKTLLPKGAKIEVRRKGPEADSGWECVKLPD